MEHITKITFTFYLCQGFRKEAFVADADQYILVL